MRTNPQRCVLRPAASVLVLAALTGAGCSGDVTRFGSLSQGTRGYAPAATYEASPQAQRPAPSPTRFAASPAGSPLPPPAQPSQASPAAAPAQVAPAQQVAAVAPARTATPGTHVVAPGDNLWGLARRYDTSRAAIASKNGISPDSTLRVGQTLAIPQPGEIPAEAPVAEPVQVATAQPVAATPAAPAVTIDAPQVAAEPTPAAPTQVAAVAPAPSAPAASKTDVATTEKVVSNDDDSFRWPVRGRIISEFGKKPDGQKNDGINLVVPEGTPVKASRDGEVIYAGDELEGYGKLVLVRHPGNWVTAYAHNSELLVKRGDQVRRGQPVAKAGRTGSVSFPQVHFEIRKGATPVDPMSHLQG